MSVTHTLTIDFGSKNIGIALVRNQEGSNTPLFAGTVLYDRFTLSKKVEPLVQMRRMLRTKKTKKVRLARLQAGPISLGLEPKVLTWVVNYCRRRGGINRYSMKGGSKEARNRTKGPRSSLG